MSHFCGFLAGVLKRKFRVPETRRSVLAKKPSGYVDSRMVYHSIIRGKSGRGIVKAKRSNNSERNTTLSTLIAIANLVGGVGVDQRNRDEVFESGSNESVEKLFETEREVHW